MARGGGVQFKMIGARQLEANLNDLGKSLAKATLERALVRVGAPIVTAAKAHAPKGGTGLNEKKITSSFKLSAAQARQAGAQPKTRTTLYIGVRPSPVAHLIEFGTGPRWTTGGGDARRANARRKAGRHKPAYRGVMPPQPFMRPAWDGGKMGALDDLGVILGEEIEKTAARLGRRRAKG